MIAAAAIVAGTFSFASGATAGTVSVSTTTEWNGSEGVLWFGYPATATFGQTVTVPAEETQLDSFTFYMLLPTSLVFRAEVYAWDDSTQQATGPALYESAPTHTDTANGYEAMTFDTGGIDLSPGAKYVLFATIAKDYAADTNAGRGAWGFVPSDAYSGGGFVFQNDGGDPGLWTTAGWSTIGLVGGTSDDLAFTAAFSSPDKDLMLTGTPTNMTVDATGPTGTPVTFVPPTAVDEDGGANAAVGCTPASGSLFAIGTTTVTCTASDPDDLNSPVSSSFTVTVEGATAQLNDLLAGLQGVGSGKSLAAKVALVQSQLSLGATPSSCHLLGAVINQLNAQAGKAITTGTADLLVADVQRIQAVLAC